MSTKTKIFSINIQKRFRKIPRSKCVNRQNPLNPAYRPGMILFCDRAAKIDKRKAKDTEDLVVGLNTGEI